MTDHESHRRIEDLLRAEKPRVFPPTGLEERILSSIEAEPRHRKSRVWPWLMVSSAAALGVFMLRPAHQPLQHAPATTISIPTETLVNEVVTEKRKILASFENPMARETLALRRDAGRAGRFLINCLPSLGKQSE